MESFNAIYDEKLIEFIPNYPVIYKLIDKNCKSNSVRENVWKEISHPIGKK